MNFEAPIDEPEIDDNDYEQEYNSDYEVTDKDSAVMQEIEYRKRKFESEGLWN